MTTADAAAALGLTPDAVRKLIKGGTLRAERRGRDWWITPAAVEAARTKRPKVGRPRVVRAAE